MKPLALQISGLNSFRRSVAIDFDNLLKDGLFGIFGPTGSGKSTILDAITLALYGRVRRAPGGTQGIINMGESRCTVNFSFMIGHEGSRRQCTVERLLARNARTGGVETKKARLSVYRDGVLEKVGEKNNELKEMVNDIVGINVDDFLRAVVLPQGAFADFLTLETRERSAVLQRLFGLYQLGDQLNHLLKQRGYELERAHAEIQGRLQDLRAYDDDALAACEDALGTAEGYQTEARAALLDAQSRHNDAAALHARIVEYKGLMEDEETRAEQRRHLAELRVRIELAERSAAVAPSLAALASARSRFEEAERSYNDAIAENEAVQGRLATARTALAGTEEIYRSRYEPLCDEINELKQLKRGKEDLAAKHERLRAIGDELLGIAHRFDTQSRLRDEAHAVIVRFEEEIAQVDRQIEERTVSADERRMLNDLQLSIQQQKNLEEELARAEREAAAVAADVDVASAALRIALENERAKDDSVAAARMSLTSRKERAAGLQRELETLRSRLQNLRDPLKDIEALERNLAAIDAELREQRVKLTGSRKMLEQGMLNLKEAMSHEEVAGHERTSLAELRDETYRHNALASLAGHLQYGVPCPLCGALEHLAPYHAGAAAIGEMEDVERELARVERKVREAEERRREIEHALAKSESALEHLELDIEQREEKAAATRAAIAETLGTIDEADPIASVEELRERIESVTAQGISARKESEELEPELKRLEEALAAADAERNRNAEERARLDASLAARRERCVALDRTVNELRARLHDEKSSFAHRSGGRTLEAAEAALEEMQRHDRHVEELRNGIRERQSQLQGSRMKLHELERDLEATGRRRSEMGGAHSNLEGEVKDLSERLGSRWSTLVPDAEREETVERLIARREELRDRIRREYEESRERYDQANSDAHVARERIESFRAIRSREERERSDAQKALEDALARHDFATSAEAEAGLVGSDELRAHREEAEAIEGALKRVELRIAELRGQIDGADISDDELALLADELARTRSIDEEAIRALGAAQQKLKECRERNAEWRNVSRQDLTSLEEKATADQLSKYLRGNGFIDFLANERLSEICRRASMQLDKLTGGRFELDTRPKDGFIIRDNGNGGGERSPSSLSGGETFLVSLSLAVALSDTIQLGHAPLEFFFLDEGFGTLDSELLETVMNTLDRLRSGHRAIGVISHVTQLRERINRRLIVTPASEVEGSTVRYEIG